MARKKRRSRKSPKRWIQSATKRMKKGALHRQLGIPIGTTIPLSLLKRAAKAKGLLGRRARFALNLRRTQKP